MEDFFNEQGYKANTFCKTNFEVRWKSAEGQHWRPIGSTTLTRRALVGLADFQPPSNHSVQPATDLQPPVRLQSATDHSETECSLTELSCALIIRITHCCPPGLATRRQKLASMLF